MAEGLEHGARIRFGEYEADLRAGELRKHGRRLRLTGRPMQILALLLERPGELLTRQELREKLWPADTFVDFEHSVNTAVQALRQALGDSPKKPRFIETLPRRGYRFIAQTARVAREHRAADPLPAPPFAQAAENGAAPAEQPTAPAPLVGQIARLTDSSGREFVLLPVDEAAFDELECCERAGDDLGIPLLVEAGKLLMVPCGTKVKILDARQPQRGCPIRILEGEFYGQKAFAPRTHLAL
jgi:DNA-binding winged helix-turn-helix (wHTH) protein